MRGAEAAEHVRFLLERLNRSNGTERPFPELVDSLLDGLRPLLAGKDPHRLRLAGAALKAIERANDIALEAYLTLNPGGRGTETRRPANRPPRTVMPSCLNLYRVRKWCP
jgi:hypothetical protein